MKSDQADSDRSTNDSRSKRSASGCAIPKKPPKWFINGFHRFLVSYLRRHFDTVAIDRERRWQPSLDSADALIVYANHPSWWDPLIAQYLNRVLFEPRRFFAPIDADALQQYKVFEKLGFFGVKMANKSGVAAFLNASAAILDEPDAALWITPEGQFTDVRDHSPELMPGLAHLCNKRANIVALPLALEYTFWNERLPVCLVSLGEPLDAAAHPHWSKAEWSEHLRDGLRTAQNRLRELSVQRNPDVFDHLLTGTRGGGWMYDTARRMKSWMTGKQFKASHGESFE